MDNCQVCRGRNGGVPGNENVIGGVTMCDYCHAAIEPALRAAREEHGPVERCPVCRHDMPHVGCVTATLQGLGDVIKSRDGKLASIWLRTKNIAEELESLLPKPPAPPAACPPTTSASADSSSRTDR